MNTTPSKVWPLALTVRAQGDANHYAILHGNDWLAALQINGELTTPAQTDLARVLSAAPVLLDALALIQANPNDPRAHRAALDAIRLAGSTEAVRNYFDQRATLSPSTTTAECSGSSCTWGPRSDGDPIGEECTKCGAVIPF